MQNPADGERSLESTCQEHREVGHLQHKMAQMEWRSLSQDETFQALQVLQVHLGGTYPYLALQARLAP